MPCIPIAIKYVQTISTIAHCIHPTEYLFVLNEPSTLVLLQGFDNVEDFMQTVQSDVAFLCGQNVVMWDQYLEVVTLNDKITHQLAKEHHLQRVSDGH